MFQFVFGMANPAQHGKDMSLVDKVDGGLPADNVNDEDLSDKETEDEELLGEK